MSRRQLLVFAVIAGVLTAGSAFGQALAPANRPLSAALAELLDQDRIAQAEAQLAAAPRTAETLAFKGEVEYRKGRFEAAGRFYHDALELNEKTARAHFGVGKLALAKLKAADAVKSLKQIGRAHV